MRLTCILLATLIAACSNPRKDSQAVPATPQPEPTVATPAVVDAILLQPAYTVDARFRTLRTLRVEELTETERFLTEASEATLTRVLNVDDRGRLMGIQRTWENSATCLTRGFGTGEQALGELHGCTLELRRRAGGVEATLIAGEASIGRQNFLMEGFEVALLPLDPVRQGQRWTLETAQLSGLTRMLEGIGFKVEKNRMTCVLAEATSDRATVTLDWQLSGMMSGNPAVLAFEGRIVFDRVGKLVSELQLTGGRGSGSSYRQQIEISLTRRPVDGWLDLAE